MRARMFRGGVLVALALASLTACDLTVSLSGLTGGEVASADGSVFEAGHLPPPDASPTHDAAAADASPISDGGGAADATTPPDATTSDSGTDGGEAGEDAGYCLSLSPSPTFCDDFDHAPLATIWDNVVNDNGTVKANSDESVSAPNSADFEIQKVASNGNADVELNKLFSNLTGQPLTLSLSFDILFDAVDEESTPAGSIMCAIDLIDENQNLYEVQIVVAFDGNSGMTPTMAQMTIENDGGTIGYKDKDLGQSIPLYNWSHVELDYRIPYPDAGSPPDAAAGNWLDFSIGGTLVGGVAVTDTIVNGSPRLVIGTGYVTPGSSPWTFHIDNVVFNATPIP